MWPDRVSDPRTSDLRVRCPTDCAKWPGPNSVISQNVKIKIIKTKIKQMLGLIEMATLKFRSRRNQLNHVGLNPRHPGTEVRCKPTVLLLC